MLVKYPRTPHLPYSQGMTNDDRVLRSDSHFYDMSEIIVTEKMDGENCTLYKDYIHARSLNSKHHESRAWIKQLWNNIKNEIPSTFRVCGENLFAKHSIYYEGLESYFLVFSIWDNNKCLSWDDTIQWVELLNLKTVPVLYKGKYSSNLLSICFTGQSQHKGEQEGFVVRNSSEFEFDDFDKNMAKFVRKNHVQTSQHWMSQQITQNQCI